MGRGGEAGEGSRHTASLHAAWMPRAREEPRSSPDHAPGDGAGRPVPGPLLPRLSSGAAPERRPAASLPRPGFLVAGAGTSAACPGNVPLAPRSVSA